MAHKLLLNTSFHLLLVNIDEDLAAKTLEANSPCCDARLHLADYPRVPHGMPAEFRQHYERRLSFCCSNCRKRTTPLSVRFFGRRWFAAPILILISVLSVGISECRLAQVKRHLGIVVSETTWKRWRRWWRDSFIVTPFWQQAKGLLSPPSDTRHSLPRVLLTQFQGKTSEQLPLLLRFLSPMTAGSLRAV